jgi:hypothetical protein
LVQAFEISGNLDRHAAEVLRLEVRRLAQQYGADVKRYRIEREAEPRKSSARGQ